MRLLRLKVKNIASFRGEHSINFSDIQNQGPLFAITGETGSGKSSILNAIGLALYGQVYKKNVNQLDVVTLGEKEGQIELIFQIKGKYYLSTWKGRVLKQNGEPYAIAQTPIREIYTLEGSDFDSPKNISTKKVEELINLDFEQFCKCIILNQGEFAKFLMSNFTERKEILEKLYPGEILEGLNRELKFDLDEHEKKMAAIENELGTLKGDELNFEELIKERDDLSVSLKLHENWFTHLSQLEMHLSSLSSYHVRYQENLKKVQQNKSEQSGLTTLFNNLLKETELISLEFDKVSDEYSHEFPKLQELLITEEKQKHLEEALREHSQRSLKMNSSLSETKERLNTLHLKKIQWDLKKGQFVFHFPEDLLKKHHGILGPLCDVFNEKELLEKELKLKSDNILHVEVQGKEIKTRLQLLMNEKKDLPDNPSEILLGLNAKKKILQTEWDKKQKAEGRYGELIKQKEDLAQESCQVTSRKNDLLLNKKSIEQEVTPLETIIKLHHFILAIETCFNHPEIAESGNCPVCHSHLSAKEWAELKKCSQGQEIEKSKKDLELLKRTFISLEEELKLLDKNLLFLTTQILKNTSEIDQNNEDRLKIIPDLLEVETQLQKAQKSSSDLENINKQISREETELKKARDQYLMLKNEFSEKNQYENELSERLSSFKQELDSMIESQLTRPIVDKIKTDKNLMDQFLLHEGQGENIHKEMAYYQDEEKKSSIDKFQLDQEIEVLKSQVTKGKTILEAELKGQKASDMINILTKKKNTIHDSKTRKDQELKKQEMLLKDHQSRLYSLEELARDFDLQFKKEKHALQDKASEMLGTLSLEYQELNLKFRHLDIDFLTPHELVSQIVLLLCDKKNDLKEKTQALQMKYAGILANLGLWEKRQDKIAVLDEQKRNLQKDFLRLQNLFEVLGKDELRTFVLSLVEENLITQTNDELQKLCQGRYEIIHQSRRMRMTPEFYILDKFREGGLRKVSTLSGGETFMVSLAMALALAEMTRGQAEIDTLFIDEGFGTLDQDSLEDVLDMLKQIQTRGLMVGVISHIKALTESLPVNLYLNKKADGTSSIQVRYN